MKYARKQVTDHGHATLEGVRGIRTDVPIRSSVRSPFPPFRIKSKQKVLRLNADLLDGYHAGAIPVGHHHATHETGGSDAIAAIDASIVTSGVLAQQRGGLGKALNLTGLADQYYLYYDAGTDTFKVTALPAGAAHNILSATHSDTLVDSVVAGDIIIGNATPKWARLAKGTDSYVLTIDPTTHLPSWKASAGGGGSPHNLLDGSVDQDTDAGSVVLGDLIAGNSTPHWQRVAGQITSTRKFLRQTGTGSVSALPAWDTVIDADVVFSNVTTGDVSTSQHGFAPKAPNDATQYLNGTGGYSVPPTSGYVLLGSSQLGSPAASISLTPLTAKNTLLIQYFVTGFSGADYPTLRFNNDSGANYTRTSVYNNATSSASGYNETGDATLLIAGASGVNQYMGTLWFSNYASVEKLGTCTEIENTPGTGASHGTYVALWGFKWVNTSAQISRVDLIPGWGHNLLTDSWLAVYGS